MLIKLYYFTKQAYCKICMLVTDFMDSSKYLLMGCLHICWLIESKGVGEKKKRKRERILIYVSSGGLYFHISHCVFLILVLLWNKAV